MYVCKSCGQTYSAHTTICSKCGNAVVVAPNAAAQSAGTQTYNNQQPYNSAPAYNPTPIYNSGASYSPSYPVTPAKPAPSGGAIALGIIGLLMGIEGFIASFISMICSIASVVAAVEIAEREITYSIYRYSHYSENIDYIESFAIFAFVQLSISILGLVFCSISRGKGVGGVAVTGKVFTIISLVFSAIATFASIAALVILN